MPGSDSPTQHGRGLDRWRDSEGWGGLGGLSARAARLWPDAPALRIDDSTLTYAELDNLVEQISTRLAAIGVGPGARVALSAANGIGFVTAVWAILRRGACAVMVSTAWREAEVTHAIELTSPTHVVTDASGATDLRQALDGRSLLDLRSVGNEAHPVEAAFDPIVGLDDLAVMVFSSGTTGLPKAVCHSHRTLLHATGHWIDSLGLTSSDRLQIATPPFHILGLLNVFAVVAAGASMRLHARFELDAVLGAIEADRVTIEMAVAPIALAMASHPELERYDLSSLRYIMWGATPVTPSVAETVTRRSGARFLPAYGASELPVLAANPVHRPDQWRLDSVGVPPAGVELRVVDLDTGAVLPPGSTGELHGRSAAAMVGYLPETANAEAFSDGWYRTGDVGAIDAQGWVTISDRVKEMIKVNGFQVAPAEIEAVLLGHPAVADCAVFGVPDARRGESVVAAVVAAPGAVTADELRKLVAERLASYKQVSEVRFVDVIPRLPSGKVLRRQLRAADQ